MQELIHVITLWLSVTFGLPDDQEPPRIRHLAGREIAEIRYGRSSVDVGEVISVYDDLTGTIFLRSDWDSRSVVDVSVLVHELVHHLQNLAGQTYACPQEREALAYEAQERWLKLFGADLRSAFGIDAFTLKVKTACAPL